MDIKLFRKTIGMTQQEFGALLGVTQGAVSHWERGASRPSGVQARVIITLSNGLVTLEEIYPAVAVSHHLNICMFKAARSPGP